VEIVKIKFINNENKKIQIMNTMVTIAIFLDINFGKGYNLLKALSFDTNFFC